MASNKPLTASWLPSTALLLGLLLGLSCVPVASSADTEIPPASYQTPDEAAKALLDALASGNEQTIVTVLGNKYADQLFIKEHDREEAQFAEIVKNAKDALQLRQDDANTRVLVIGKNAWPMPIPLVHDDKGWHFDTATGIQEILARRIGADELAAIDLMRAYVDAQMAYAAEDHDGSQVLKYAQKLISSPGKKDGLYWAAKDGEEQSPFGPFVAELPPYLQQRDLQKDAEKQGKQKEPYMGYYFRVLTRQGENAPGGRYDYIINGNMIAGFGLVAVPAEYGETGVMTFVVSHQGKIFQKDLGDDTPVAAAAIQEYNPDDSWDLVDKK